MSVTNVKYLLDIAKQAFGNSVAQLIAVAGIPILARLYSPETFAIQSVFLQVVIFFTALVTFRYEYFIPLLRSKDESVLLVRWIVRIGLLMVCFLTALVFLFDQLDFNFLLAGDSAWYFYLAPITAYMVSIATLFQFEAQRAGIFNASAISEVISKISYVLSGIALSIVTVGLGLILTTLFSALSKLVYLREHGVSFSLIKLRSTSTSERGLISKFKSRSLGMVLSNSLLVAASLVPLSFIGSNYGANALGQFSLVMATVFLPSALVGSAIGSVFYQRAAILWHEKTYLDLHTLWLYTVRNLFLIAVPIYGLIYLLSAWAYPFVFGEQWSQAGHFAKVLTIAAFFSFLAGPLDRVSLIVGISVYLPILHFARLAILLAACFITARADGNVEFFLVLYSSAMAFIYIVDILIGRFFLSLSKSKL
ncbi:lipopolysaccharide biosynthesis protein [Atopomonas sediminilitoris]|uniref:lipopolysaccharide biosynthesis protein n=1 Tax=Atopomonas sediminilitoris TaxID=2919919 RepID=UPI001F4E53BE|nr:oligosaccharide flippase family protein [Atopomonas sediminilitoris]MCJ8168338.1 oligosaccharide flippase family protein [Atopomonas sediminilitoris]